MALIEIRNVNFRYPGMDTYAIEDINLDIDKGEFVLICGPSGCGKTTLVKQLLPAITPYGRRDGDVRFMGHDIAEYEESSLAGVIGYVSQNPMSQIITDKVWHEIVFGMESLNLSQDVMERRMAEISEFFGMQEWLDRDVDTLSGGQMQILHLASVMVMEPELLVLDEPVAQLDPVASRNFLDMLRRINDEIGTTIVIVEHHLEEVYGMVDRVVAMSKSRIDVDGEPRFVAANMKYDSYLPSVVKIVRNVDKDIEDMPLSVSEGQRWLQKKIEKLGTDRDYSCNFPEAAKNDSKEVLKIKDVAFAYEDGKEVLKDCNLSVNSGEIFALLGGNGTGKSTLLYVLCRTRKESYGTIKVFGNKIKDIKDAPLGCGGMVYMPQDPMAIFTEINVHDELREAMVGLDISSGEKEERISQMLSRLELAGYEKVHPYDLSSGQMQLLALGKLLLLEPKIILMDEPTKGLDYDRKLQFGSIMDELVKKDVAILMVSHDVEFCARFASRCALMHNGKIVAASPSREFFSGNRFFTTYANRMARAYMSNAILPEEVVKCLSELE